MEKAPIILANNETNGAHKNQSTHYEIQSFIKTWYVVVNNYGK